MTDKEPNDIKRLIFSINSGRTGSQYLKEILGTHADILSFHEAQPNMAFGYLKLCKNRGLKETWRHRHIKVAAIKNSLRPNKIYSETSHLFIKSFYDVVMNEFLPKGYRIDVIVLRRYLPNIVNSLMRLNWEGCEPNWYYRLGDAISVLKRPSKKLIRMDEVLGYLFDIEAQVHHFQRLYPKVNLIDARLETIQTPEEIMGLFDKLDLSHPNEARLNQVAGKPVNQVRLKKKPSALSDDKEAIILRRVAYMQRLMESEGIALPPLPHLDKIT